MHVTLRNDEKELARLTDFLSSISRKYHISDEDMYAINLSLDELVTNIIHYGNISASSHIDIDVTYEASGITIVITDEGVAFNPLDQPDPDVSQSVEERKIGGLGIYFVKKKMDSVQYRREGNKNILTLIKHIH